MHGMAGDRIVVGASGDDARARTAARRLLEDGHEVVYVGGHQRPEQLARAAVAEDARRIVVDADAPTLRQVVASCGDLGADDIVVDPVV